MNRPCPRVRVLTLCCVLGILAATAVRADGETRKVEAREVEAAVPAHTRKPAAPLVLRWTEAGPAAWTVEARTLVAHEGMALRIVAPGLGVVAAGELDAGPAGGTLALTWRAGSPPAAPPRALAVMASEGQRRSASLAAPGPDAKDPERAGRLDEEAGLVVLPSTPRGRR